MNRGQADNLERIADALEALALTHAREQWVQIQEEKNK